MLSWRPFQRVTKSPNNSRASSEDISSIDLAAKVRRMHHQMGHWGDIHKLKTGRTFFWRNAAKLEILHSSERNHQLLFPLSLYLAQSHRHSSCSSCGHAYALYSCHWSWPFCPSCSLCYACGVAHLCVCATFWSLTTLKPFLFCPSFPCSSNFVDDDPLTFH